MKSTLKGTSILNGPIYSLEVPSAAINVSPAE